MQLKTYHSQQANLKLSGLPVPRIESASFRTGCFGRIKRILRAGTEVVSTKDICTADTTLCLLTFRHRCVLSITSGFWGAGRRSWNASSLTVLTLPVFVPYSDVVLGDDGSEPAIWHIPITEYMAIAILRFLAAARVGPIGVLSKDPQMGGNGLHVLVPLPSSIHCEVDGIGLLKIIGGSAFNGVTSLIASCRSSEVDWTLVDPDQCLYLYHFASGRVCCAS